MHSVAYGEKHDRLAYQATDPISNWMHKLHYAFMYKNVMLNERFEVKHFTITHTQTFVISRDS